MKKDFFIIGFLMLMILSILISCKSRHYYFNETHYNDNIGLFPDSILNGLPEKWNDDFDSLTFTFPASLEHNVNYCGIFFQTKPKPEIFDKYMDSLEKYSIYHGFVTDSVLYPITKKNYDDCIYDSCYYPQSHKYFFPKLNDKYSYYENIFLEGAEIYILAYSLDNVLELPKDKRPNNFPNELKTGYSKGAFIDRNSKIIYYWLMVW